VAFAGIEGAVGGDAGDLLVGRDLILKFGQDRGVTHIAGGELGGADFQRLLVNSDVELAPDPALRATMLARLAGKQSPGLFSDPLHSTRLRPRP